MMRKLLILFCLLFGVLVSSVAQNKLDQSSLLNKAWNIDYKTANDVSNSLFSLLEKQYIRENYTSKGYYIVAFYPDEFNRDNDVPFIKFSFLKTIINANKDLGIEGEKVFRLNEIEGQFLDLYVIWEKFCSDLNVSPESKESIVNKTIKKSDEISWINANNEKCAIQLHNKNYGNSSTWVISYRVYIN